MRQEITRSGSHDNINTKETEITEVTETIEGGTVTTVKRKVVTVSHGKEEIVEDSQILLDENHTTFSSVVDSGFVVVDKEDTPDSSLDTTAITEDQGNYLKINVYLSLVLYASRHSCFVNKGDRNAEGFHFPYYYISKHVSVGKEDDY